MKITLGNDIQNKLRELSYVRGQKLDVVINDLLGNALNFYQFTDRFINRGKKWTEEEYQRLEYLYVKNKVKKPEDLAAHFKRTPSAITSKLAYLGFLWYNKNTRQYEKGYRFHEQ